MKPNITACLFVGFRKLNPTYSAVILNETKWSEESASICE